jgi:hypothetical protein
MEFVKEFALANLNNAIIREIGELRKNEDRRSLLGSSSKNLFLT